MKFSFADRGELCLYGISSFCAGSELDSARTVMGRLVSDISGDCMGSLLVLQTSDALAKALPTISVSPPCGLLVFCQTLPSSLLESLLSLSLPFLLLAKGSSLPPSSLGKVGILDVRRGVLVINPDIDRLNAYALTVSKPSPVSPAPLILKSSCNTLLLTSLERDGTRLLSRLAQNGISSPEITVLLRAPASPDAEEKFCEAIELCFHRALYTRLSILLDIPPDAADIKHTLSLLKRVFCRMEECGREFNGYPRRGLLLSTPASLVSIPFEDAFDFFCLDTVSVLSHTFGIQPHDSRRFCESETDMRRMLVHLLKKREHRELLSICKHPTLTPEARLCSAADEILGITQAYLPDFDADFSSDS